MIPVITQTPVKNANTLASIENTIQYGTPTSAVSASNQRMRIMPRPRPTPPLMKASSRLSTINWRTMRHLVAPSATRTAISRDRMRRARQQQVGDVRAGDEQHERDGAHQRPEHGADLRAEHALHERRRIRRHVLVGVLVLLRQLRGDVGELAARLLERHPIGQAPVDHVVTGLRARLAETPATAAPAASTLRS